MKTLSRDLRSRALHETSLPVPYDAAAVPGARVLGEDGREYVAQRWPTDQDEYTWVSAAQIASDVAADFFRAITTPQYVEVDVSAPSNVEGQTYTTLGGALEYCAKFLPTYREADADSQPLIYVKILDTGPISEQLVVRGANLSNVRIVSEAHEVTIDPAGLTRADTIGQHIFLQGRQGAALPVLEGVRWVLGSGAVPQDQDRIDDGELASGYTPEPIWCLLDDRSSVALAGAEAPVTEASVTGGTTPAPYATYRCSEVDGAWHRCVTVLRTCSASFTDARLTTTDGVAAELRGDVRFVRCVVRGSFRSLLALDARVGLSGFEAGAGGMRDDGSYAQDFRIDPATDGNSDIVVRSAAIVTIESGVRGGTSQSVNAWTYHGFIAEIP